MLKTWFGAFLPDWKALGYIVNIGNALNMRNYLDLSRWQWESIWMICMCITNKATMNRDNHNRKEDCKHSCKVDIYVVDTRSLYNTTIQ